MSADSLILLIESLSDGAFHSGSELAETFKLSRAAINNKIQKLRELGLDIFSVTGKGYRLAEPVELLAYEKINKTGALSGYALDILFATESTNLFLMQQSPLQHGHCCLAEYQTMGKGRQGKTWCSPFAANIYCSLAWHFDGALGDLSGLSLVVGLAVQKAIAECCEVNTQLKWPNDILTQQGKLAGILIEIRGESSGRIETVIGVGINVKMPDTSMVDIDQPWCDLSQLSDQAISRNELAKQLIVALHQYLNLFQEKGFSAFRDDWLASAAYLNELVCLQTASQKIEGKFVGVDQLGALMLSIDEQVKTFHGGELSMRPRAV